MTDERAQPSLLSQTPPLMTIYCFNIDATIISTYFYSHSANKPRVNPTMNILIM